MQKVKKKKNNKHKELDNKTVIRMTNYLNLACAITAIWDNNTIEERETKREDVVKFVTAYKIYLQEIADKRQTVDGAVIACMALTGIDVIDVIDEVFGGTLI